MANLVEMTDNEIIAFINRHQDKIGVRSGRLISTGIVGKDRRNNVFVNTLCDCGNICQNNFYDLKTGHVQSCGCLRKEKASEKRKDLTGMTFGWYYVESYAYSINKKPMYNCVCICGTRKIVSSSQLVSGRTKSCGCYSRQMAHNRLIDLTGKKFYDLTVKSFAGVDSNYKTLWLCVCKCGTEKIYRGDSLKSGNTKSCGCLKSLGEKLVKDFLNNHGISYKTEYGFEDCRISKPLRFDFYIPNIGKNGSCIEFDGIQHYQESRSYSDTISLQERKRRDQIKSDYCKTHDIRLLRIPYWERDNIESILNDWLFINSDEDANSSITDLSA